MAAIPVAQNTAPTISAAGNVTGTQLGGTNTNAQAATVQGANTNAQAATVDPSSIAQVNTGSAGTVAGQVNNIIDANSPLMQRAAATADQASNSRGLFNSSMAIGASQGAVMDAALPIAQADAASTNQIATTNAGALNTGLLASTANKQQTNLSNQNATNTVALADASNTQQTNLANQTATNTIAAQDAANTQQANLADQAQANSVGIANANNAVSTNNANLSASAQAAIATAQQQNAVLLQNSGAASSAFNNLQQTISQIDQSTTMDANAKSVAIGQAQDAYNTQIAGITAASPGVPNVASTLNTGNQATDTVNAVLSGKSTPAQQTLALQTAQDNYNALLATVNQTYGQPANSTWATGKVGTMPTSISDPRFAGFAKGQYSTTNLPIQAPPPSNPYPGNAGRPGYHIHNGAWVKN